MSEESEVKISAGKRFVYYLMTTNNKINFIFCHMNEDIKLKRIFALDTNM
jgi:DNA recombination-dependent growth factor C